MITQEMSEVTEQILRMASEIPVADRTATILFLSTYLMHHAGTLLDETGDKETAKAYAGLARQMEALMQSARADGNAQRLSPNLKLVK